jgi:hypothetical protein
VAHAALLISVEWRQNVMSHTTSDTDPQPIGNDAAVAALDTPIHRATIDKLPIAVLDEWLDRIRVRRLHIVESLAVKRAAKREARLNDIAEKYTRVYARIEAKMTKLDEGLAVAEKDLQRLRALHMELSDDDGEEIDTSNADTDTILT